MRRTERVLSDTLIHVAATGNLLIEMLVSAHPHSALSVSRLPSEPVQKMRKCGDLVGT
jgi:hypothetical protein